MLEDRASFLGVLYWDESGLIFEQLVFDTNRNGHWDIYMMESQGSAELRLTRDVAADESPVWRPWRN